MDFFLVGFGLAFHVLFWGAGAACLLAPARWRRWWPVFAFPCGFALQSAVVWGGALTGLQGTDSYAHGSLLLPLALMVAAVVRTGPAVWWRQLAAFRGLGALMAAALGLLLLPLAASSDRLTTSSLGSCDAADYAAGARVFKEFSRDDRTGFLGLTEVVQIESADNFHAFWLRLNHFTPSALIAINGSVFRLEPYQLISVLAALFIVATMPAVHWLARSGLGLRTGPSLWVAALYGLNPLNGYAFAQVAMGQLLAAQAIALLTWVGVVLWRSRLSLRGALAWAGLLGIAWWLLLGSYNFIIVVALVPAVAYAGGAAILGGKWLRLAGWLAALLVPLALTGMLFAERVAGLVERFRLFRAYDFGWKIPALTPEGWLGAVGGAGLGPLPPVTRMLLGAGLLVLMIAGLRRANRRTLFVAASVTVPIAVGYAYLHWRGARMGTNASYDAYKLLSVFLPGILAALCLWAGPLLRSSGLPRWLGWAGVAGVSLLVWSGSGYFRRALSRPPLIVDAALVRLQDIESRSEVGSVNMKIPDMWSRLWANSFLLRLPQYFPTHTYEGRRNTPLRGDWDLVGGVVAPSLPENGTIEVGPGFRLVDTRSPFLVEVTPEAGWYDLEQSPRDGRRWRWTGAQAVLRVANPGNGTLRTEWRLRDVHSLEPRTLSVVVNGAVLATFPVDAQHRDIFLPTILVPPGGIELAFVTPEVLTNPGRGDTRGLAFRFFGIEVNVRLPSPAEPGSSAPEAAAGSGLARTARGR